MPAHIRGIPGVEIYNKPSTDQWIMRETGVTRKSEAVIAQNERFATTMKGKKIATACKQPADKPVGQKYKAFKACLRHEGKKAFGKA